LKKVKKYKLIVVDIDGTLLNSESRLSKYTEKILWEFIASGGYVVLATGKLFRTIKSLCRIFSLKTKQIIANGNILVDPITETHEIICQLEPYSLKNIRKILKDFNVQFVYYKSKRIFYEIGACSHTHLKRLVKEGELFPKPLADYSSWDFRGVVKALSFVAEKDKNLEEKIRKKTNDICPNIKVMRSSPYYLEYVHKNTSKLKALFRILKDLNVNLERVVAFGDSESDLEIIKRSGIGVAMGNALPVVKKTANYLTKSNDCDGVAYFIYHFLLKNNKTKQPPEFLPSQNL